MRILTLLLAALALPANAQEAAELPGDPATWFAEQEATAIAPDLESLRGEVLDRARWSTVSHGCKVLTKVDPYGLQPATADRLVSEGLKAGAFTGAWTFYGKTDCPETPLIRYLYIAESDGRHLIIVVNRGEAISTPSQMRETSKLAAKAVFDRAKLDQPKCEEASVAMRQTRITATDGNLSAMQFGTRFSGGWSEAWDFIACGRNATVTVRFDSDGKGGADARITGLKIS